MERQSMPPVFSSRYESFRLAMEEIHACDCAVVDPSEILSNWNKLVFSAPFLTTCWQSFGVPLLYLVSTPPPQKLPNK